MEESARKLDRQIRTILAKPAEEMIKEIQEIPPFLDGHGSFWSWRCAETGQPIRYPLFPKFSTDLMEKNSSLAEICYEKSLINDYLTCQRTVPLKWPSEYLEFTQDNVTEDLRIQSTIDQQLIIALQELKQYHPIET